MAVPQYGDYQHEIYLNGLDGRLPRHPVDFSSLERAAAEVLPSFVQSYVASGCGDEGTQRANVDAFSRYAIVPRMLVGATELDLLTAIDGFPAIADLRAAGAQHLIPLCHN
jgi:hypothetical protein